jgi:hypothetical protein
VLFEDSEKEDEELVRKQQMVNPKANFSGRALMQSFIAVANEILVSCSSR